VCVQASRGVANLNDLARHQRVPNKAHSREGGDMAVIFLYLGGGVNSPKTGDIIYG